MIKKKITIIAILLILIVIGIIWKINYDINKEKNYYQNLKDNIQEDIERVLHITNPYCSVENASFYMLFEAEQGDYYLIDKKKFLDIDGKSYCKVKVKTRCVSKDKFEWKTYIKCNDYEDDGYNSEK